LRPVRRRLSFSFALKALILLAVIVAAGAVGHVVELTDSGSEGLADVGVLSDSSSGEAPRAKRPSKRTGTHYKQALLDFDSLAQRCSKKCCGKDCCGNVFRDAVAWSALKAHRVHFSELHKLDQDHMIFHLLRDQVVVVVVVVIGMLVVVVVALLGVCLCCHSCNY
jgi:hypothetical protein